MSFHETSTHIELEEGHILRAILRTEDGGEKESIIDLNHCIGNDNGRFLWGSSDFSASACDIRFDIEGEESVPVLRAVLRDVDNEEHNADVNLAERIGNDNGNLVFN
ncbi:Cyanovirin-N [Penicillium digitatum]|uniref:Cyanovirin-N domain-containing protein n=3 Tax=Penicillium digitatum TaxID=36651 RepID=K9GC66_PEND2|nr:hypothetical protein PDIP_48610 [Penicillium digitatum Pd1]EKV10851.1 hypothetical protein PDIG_53390 [Penicillium digitatum PHI26]EKV13368.1 hypothetical protein PDIP_48610 [Penicillium digitatum Pd1]KAG0155629.1 hypothetical protein PDIDSM_2802 [Penicillium digitatum]QQK43570.1 Cyanovirin-N [Penicillium digitatum]